MYYSIFELIYKQLSPLFSKISKKNNKNADGEWLKYKDMRWFVSGSRMKERKWKNEDVKKFMSALLSFVHMSKMLEKHKEIICSL